MASRSTYRCLFSHVSLRAASTTRAVQSPLATPLPSLCQTRSYSHDCFPGTHVRRPQTLITRSATTRIRSISQTRPRYQYNNHVQDESSTNSSPKSASKRKSQKPSSLRRVAVEAQYSHHGFIKRNGKRRFVDPDADTNEVAAYCAAEQYSIPTALHLLKLEGYHIDPFNTALYPQVIHAQLRSHNTKNAETGEECTQGPADLFVFPSGSIVTWNIPERRQQDLVKRVLVPAAENPHLDTIEIEDLEYLEDATTDTSCIVGDTIILGTKASSSSNGSTTEEPRPTNLATTTFEDSQPIPSPDTATILAKIAFSSGLARSAKLAVLENTLASYFSSTRSISTTLSKGAKPRFTRSFVLRKTGELLSIRAQLNLYAELTDSLPDLFWDSPSSLGLSDYYDQVGRALDVNARIRVLNEKIDYASEIATVLREHLSEKHSIDLEWLIIFLISVEVVFELWRIWREKNEMEDPDSTEALLKEYLLRERQRSQVKA